MQTRSRQTGTLTYHGDGLHIPPGRNEAVHLRLSLNREPVPQSIPHTRIEPHGSHSGATAIRRLTNTPGGKRSSTMPGHCGLAVPFLLCDAVTGPL